jgi:hypothetical protein
MLRTGSAAHRRHRHLYTSPSTILRLGGFFDANDEREHAEDE